MLIPNVKTTLSNIWLDANSKEYFTEIRSVISKEPGLILTEEFCRAEVLAGLLITQGESIAILGPRSSGKETLVRHLLKVYEDKISSGSIYCSPILEVNALKEYADRYYMRKKNVATPLIWKAVVFSIEDLHMTYPSNMQVPELLRFWNDWRGYYDTKDYKFKSVNNFSLMYTAEDSVIHNSMHLKRLLNGIIKIQLTNNNLQGVFIDKWTNKAYDKEVLKRVVSELKVSNTLLHTLCKSLNKVGGVLHLELNYFLVDRNYKPIKKEAAIRILKKEFPHIDSLKTHEEQEYSMDKVRSMVSASCAFYLFFDVIFI
jgi:energy-coupling factor transporter ATP-binding protein EcfA2